MEAWDENGQRNWTGGEIIEPSLSCGGCGSQGVFVVKFGNTMKKLRFMCFASLLAIILALGVVADAETSAATADVGEDTSTPVLLSSSNATEDDPLSDSATITITWTTVGPPEE